ncbi:MAG TPA: fructosamine kinase family protein [Solirubrobacteraceae bacterium]
MSLPPGARDARPVGGGDINEAFHVTLADGRDAFVKTRRDAAAGEYAAEAAGLRWLAEPGALGVPCVLEVADAYLALEWIEPGLLTAHGERELGQGLALLHGAGAPHFGSSANDGSDGWLGSLRVSNEPTDDWPTFYAERRLLPLARMACDGGALSPSGAQAVERVCGRMGELAGPPEPAARLHGDLWQGNVLADAAGRPYLIDPSVYGGHREVDLAMLALFGSPARTIDAYEEVAPLADGWRERVGLYQLLPLLVHAVLFGGSYVQSSERMAQRYSG